MRSVNLQSRRAAVGGFLCQGVLSLALHVTPFALDATPIWSSFPWAEAGFSLFFAIFAVAGYNGTRLWRVGLFVIASLMLSMSALTQASLLASVGVCLAGIVGCIAAFADWLTRENNRPPRLRDFYEAAVKARRVRQSDEQLLTVDRLDSLNDAFERYEAKRHLPWASLLQPPRGVYLHGPAGRGKSFLLDGMFDVSVSRVKYRLHFHELMSELNKKINRGDTRLADVFRDMLPRASLVVIDEVNPLDTASSMFFIGLLETLWRRRCVVCISSNQSPDNLFAGINIDMHKLQQFTDRLTGSLDVIELAGGEDFRLQKLGAQDLYQYPVMEGTNAALDAIMQLLAEGEPSAAPVPVGSRALPCVQRAPGIAWFDFAIICGGAFSYEDYLGIVDEFPTLIVAGVPQLDDEDEARRFAWLVEIVYDHKRRLILSAHVPVDNLFEPSLSSRGVDVDFTKIISRLNEMQSSEYNYTLAQQ